MPNFSLISLAKSDLATAHVEFEHQYKTYFEQLYKDNYLLLFTI